MRPPEVFVRELSPDEGSRLKSISRKAKYQSKRQRAMIVLASSTGMSAPQIAGLVRSDESHVRKVIHAFNEQGFSSLDPDYRGGRPKKTTPEQRDQIVAVARARPDTLGVALTRWSLAKLSEHLAGLGIELCEEALRQTLRTAGLSHQRTRSWKWSPDPEFADKAQRVLGLYRSKPADGVVVCFDEMGPIQLIPHHGSGWATQKRPERLRATYSKPNGVRYLFGAYDVHADRLHGRLRGHKNAGEVLAFYQQIRMRYDPGYGSTSSPTTSPPTRHRRSASGPRPRTPSWCSPRPMPASSTASNATSGASASSSSTTPTTPTGKTSPKRWPTTSATATAPTATNA